MTQYEAWPNEPINLLVGGTPCQSFSVAGLRKGLADPRGNLMLTYGAIAKRYSPKWLVWENVPGVLSSNGGRDFGTFLGMLAELGYGFAYRVLDAQYFGVAQRRRRVFVVGYLGDWRRAAAVLFERHSLCGHPAPSRETGKDFAKCLTAGLGMRLDPETENFPIAPSVAETLIATDHKGPGHNRDHNFVAQPVAFRDPSPTLTARMQGSSGWAPQNEDAHLVGVAQPIGFGAQMSVPQTDVDLMQTLQAKNPMAVAQPVAFHANAQACQLPGPDRDTSISDSLTRSQQAAVAQPVAIGLDEEQNARMDGFGTLKARSEGGGFEGSVMTPAMQVRRLTPVECERLQGFPDGYTNIPWRGKPQAPDGPRYKAMGNSMAVPVMHWIGKRIAAVDAL
jgi:DNA (cytosine-5)-methyltransferase 1